MAARLDEQNWGRRRAQGVEKGSPVVVVDVVVVVGAAVRVKMELRYSNRAGARVAGGLGCTRRLCQPDNPMHHATARVCECYTVTILRPYVCYIYVGKSRQLTFILIIVHNALRLGNAPLNHHSVSAVSASRAQSRSSAAILDEFVYDARYYRQLS